MATLVGALFHAFLDTKAVVMIKVVQEAMKVANK
jgi:hypothetical protein